VLRKLSILVSLLVAPALFGIGGVNVFSISPESGPSSGGTVVTIKGDFSAGPYNVVFGSIPAPSFSKIDAQTLTATTPAHLPGKSTVVVTQEDVFGPGFLDFTFQDGVPEAFERILLPLLTPPVKGAFGSEFQTSFAAWNANPQGFAHLFGLESACNICLLPPVPPEQLIDVPLVVLPESGLENLLLGPVIPSGTPGRFIYVPAEEVTDLGTDLRVHDITRAALNLGTEIPVVRSREFVSTERLVLTNVPIDPRFRSTLRIYAAAATNVVVTFLSGARVGPPQRIERVLHLEAGHHLFEPAYAAVSDFPAFLTGTLPITVTVVQPWSPFGSPPQPEPPPMWAFISVTNNETQAITTITPQR
jgi:IPT/TIG domain-containing protein